MFVFCVVMLLFVRSLIRVVVRGFVVDCLMLVVAWWLLYVACVCYLFLRVVFGLSFVA